MAEVIKKYNILYKMKQTILFLRNGSLYNDIAAAKAGLAAVPHKAGQPVVALYNGKDGETAVIKLIFAIGTGEGVGKYQVLANEADFSTLSGLISDLSDALGDHIDTLAGTVAGHAKTGADLTFSNGEGTIKNNAVTTDKIAANAVTYAKLQKVVNANTVLGSKTADGQVTELTAEDLFEILKTDTTNWDKIENSGVKFGTITFADGTFIGQDTFVSKGISFTTNGYDEITEVGLKVVKGDGEEEVKFILGTAPKAAFATEAGSATKLKEAKKIRLTGEVTGEVSFDGFEHVNLEATVADNVTVSGWTLENSTATTQTKGDNSTKIATTAFVQAEIEDKLAAADALVFKGVVEKYADLPVAEDGVDMTGWTYKASTAFEVTGVGKVEAGDMIIYTGSAWSIIQTNIDGAVTSSATSSVDSDIAVFDGTTGKVIKDSGKKLSDLAASSITVSAGNGLTGGGDLTQNRTISHGALPAASNKTGDWKDLKDEYNQGFLSSVSIDNFGHAYAIGTVGITLVSSTNAGTEEDGKYISSIVIDDGGRKITANKKSESGKVKVDANDTADYLVNQVVSGTTDANNNTYAVNVNKNTSGALAVTVKIDTIDGGTY